MFTLCFLLNICSFSPNAKPSLFFNSFIIPPYSNPYAPQDGLISALVTAVFEKLNTNIEIAYHPIHVAMENLENQDTIGVFPIYPTKNDKKNSPNLLFSKPLLPIKFYVYTLQVPAAALIFTGAPKQDTTIQRLCVPRIFKSTQAIQDFIKDHQIATIFESDIAQECFIKLRTKEVDAVIDEEKNADFATTFLFQGGVVSITRSPNPLYEENFYVVFNRKDQYDALLAQKFNEALEKLKNSGEYDQIIRQFQEAWALNN